MSAADNYIRLRVTGMLKKPSKLRIE